MEEKLRQQFLNKVALEVTKKRKAGVQGTLYVHLSTKSNRSKMRVSALPKLADFVQIMKVEE